MKLISAMMAMLVFASVASAEYQAVYLTDSQDTLGYVTGNGVVGGVQNPRGQTQAVYWGGGVRYSMHPTGFAGSVVKAMSGNAFAGYGKVDNDISHALYWSTAGTTATDLNPSGGRTSNINGLDGQYAVGYGEASGYSGAMLWDVTNGTYQTLNPSGYNSSVAWAVQGGHQGGVVWDNQGNQQAAMWSGTSSSMTVLHPSGYQSSAVYGLWGNRQVGFGYDGSANGGHDHALVWSGSAASVQDLNPAWADYAGANAIQGDLVAGYAWGQMINGAYDINEHAMLWDLVSGQYTDLQLLLSSQYVSSSAIGIDLSGNVVGQALELVKQSNGPDLYVPHAMLWQVVIPTPEPATVCLVVLGFVAIAMRRRAA